MPEIKNTFTQGKMNKDLDERIIPNGQYRDAMNIQVSTSDGADVGTVQNILGNTEENTLDVDGTSTTIVTAGYECVGSIADERNDAIYSFITTNDGVAGTHTSAIVEYKKTDTATGVVTVITPVLVDTDNSVLKFEHGDIITGINIIDDLLFWTDGVNEPKKINITSFKKNNHTDLNTHSHLFVNGTTTNVNVAEDHITVIKKKPLKTLSVKINPADPENKNPLFKKIFPRFSYRYRYDDGEYSPFGPFTDVVFKSQYPINHEGELHDSNTAYAEKEPYNSGMINMIESIELTDFVSPNIPEDVVQIDLLYKQENSSVVYIMEVIRKDDTANLSWVQTGSESDSTYKGKFIVTSENIYAATPENQLLRPWDNVPRTALAQEITGNRIVYGNYVQNQTDDNFFPRITSNYKIRNTKENSFTSFLYGNLISNYNFLNNEDPWTLQTGITWNTSGWIDFGTPDSPGSPVAQPNKMIYLNNDGWGPAGTVYKIAFDVKNYQSGHLGVRLTNGTLDVSPPGDYIDANIDLTSVAQGGTYHYEETLTMLPGISTWPTSYNGRFWIQSEYGPNLVFDGTTWATLIDESIYPPAAAEEWGYNTWGYPGSTVERLSNQLVITQGSGAGDWITLNQPINLTGVNSITLSANVISAGGTIRVGLGDDTTHGGAAVAGAAAATGNNQSPNLDMGSGGVSTLGVNFMEWSALGTATGIQTLTIDTSSVTTTYVQIMEGSGGGGTSTIDDVELTSVGFEGSIDNVEVIQVSASTDSDITYEEGGLPSIKSQRNYQLGIVYGDEYGRETPVFTSAESSLVVPFRDFNQSLPSASYPLQLNATINSSHPSWADYYKFFIKETSGEYYNLVMDSLHTPTKEDLDEDDHVWLSFASSDRNKISKDDYIILKRKIDSDTQILDDNKFRVLDVQNEAPDAIKYKYVKMGEIKNTASDDSGLLNADAATITDDAEGLFHNNDYLPLSSNANNNTFLLSNNLWRENGGARLVQGKWGDAFQVSDGDLYYSFTRSTSEYNNQNSEKYRIVQIETSGSPNEYHVKLDRAVTVADSNLILTSGDVTDGSTDFHEDITVRIEKKVLKSPEVFSGRFFVKILADHLIKNELKFVEGSGALINHVIDASQNVYWQADVLNTTDNVWIGGSSYDGGLVNNSYNGDYGSITSSQTTADVTSATSETTVTKTAWDRILTEMDNGGTRFFIDNMFVSSAQHGQYARESGVAFNGGKPNAIEDSMYHCDVSQVDGSTRDHWVNTVGNSEVLSWPKNQSGNIPGNHIKWTHPTTYYDGGYGNGVAFVTGTPNTYTVNGLDGMTTTENDHIDGDGIRRWKTSLLNNTLDNTYGGEAGKFYLHLSFLAPGEDLHDGNFSSSDLNVNEIHNELQGIHGGGIFKGYPTSQTIQGTSYYIYYNNAALIAANNGLDAILMEKIDANASGVKWISSTEPNGTSCAIPLGGYNQDYKLLHEKQWDPTFPTDVGGKISDFIGNLKQGRKFRFNGDSSDQMYTIKSVKTKKVYNHSDWNIQWEPYHASQDILRISGRSVEQKVCMYANSCDSSGANSSEPQLLTDLQNRLVSFGKASNRRLVYILELDSNPTDSSTFNPTSGTLINAVTYDAIEFITDDPDLNAGEVSQNPAIWETEPKDNVDLDIYYEASQAYPIKIDANTNELFAQIGCRVEFPGTPNARQGAINIYQDVKLVSFDPGDPLKFTLSPGFNYLQSDEQNEVDYTNAEVRFTRKDGSYTTMKLDPAMEAVSGTPDYRSVFKFMPQATPLLNVETGLSWYNCFSFLNGVESDRIRDDFNAMTITNGVKANATLDRPYVEEHRKNGLIYSGIYNSTSGVNNLNQFIMAEKITKDLNPTFGSIQKLFTRRISLVAFCEDRVVGITANKSALYNADGKPQIVASDAVLGDANPFVGDYGISKNPESFAKESYRAYFTDKARGAVLRLSMDGLTPISDAGMSQWFKDEFKNPDYNFIGSYDNYKNDYNLTLDGGSGTLSDSHTLTYSEDVKGWVSFKSFIQESGVSMAGDYYTFKAGKCYKHNNASRNKFYEGAIVPSTIKFVFNESPTAIKNFNTLNYDGDPGWACDSIMTGSGGTSNPQWGTITQFIEKEGKWFDYIKGDASVTTLDTSAFNFQGIGVANNITYGL